jgi:uncharacterized phage protein (TIGR01671 family)
MNREIKFRVWCKRTKHFTNIPFYSCNGRQLLWHHTGNEISISNLDNQDGYVVQQYTGLKDRNGKEIYEGDILSLYDELHVVSWDGLMGWWGLLTKRQVIDKEHNTIVTTSKWDRFSEIVGNIFENPELLK